MRQPLLLILLALFCTTGLSAQIGTWEYVDKKNDQKKATLELRKDGSYTFTTNDGKSWKSTITEGKWRVKIKDVALLTSEYQLSDYQVEEKIDPTIEGIQVIVQGKEKGRGPHNVTKVFINEADSLTCELDSKAALKAMQERQKTMRTASAETINKLRKADLPQHYSYPKKEDVASIHLLFDGKRLDIETTTRESNVFIITTNFAKNASYHYMKETPFKSNGKFIWDERMPKLKMKKQKQR